MSDRLVYLHVRIPEDLRDELEVECEIAVVGRSVAVVEGLQLWIDRQRKNPKWKGVSQ